MRRKASKRLLAAPLLRRSPCCCRWAWRRPRRVGCLATCSGSCWAKARRRLLPLRRRLRRPTQRRPPPHADKRVPFGRAEMELSFAPLVKNTAPAVVNVYASQKVAARSPFAGDPFFEQFFGDQRMPPRVQQSLGSGVLVDPSGVVVTNFHVIRDADTVKVATSDGREFDEQGAAEGRIARPRRAQDRSAAAIPGDRHRRFRRA